MPQSQYIFAILLKLEPSMSKKVAIIGAGPAGLTAAYLLG